MVCSGSRVNPAAEASTANTPTPSPVRAATSSRSATAPSRTNDLWPEIAHFPSVSVAVVVTSAVSHEPESSAIATVAISSPEAIPGRYSLFASTSSQTSKSCAAITHEAKNGETTSARPISSSASPNSTNENPLPPYSSGIARLCKPSWSAIWRHSAWSYPQGSVIWSRTADSDDLAPKKSRNTACRVACSSLSAKSTATHPASAENALEQRGSRRCHATGSPQRNPYRAH